MATISELRIISSSSRNFSSGCVTAKDQQLLPYQDENVGDMNDEMKFLSYQSGRNIDKIFRDSRYQISMNVNVVDISDTQKVLIVGSG